MPFAPRYLVPTLVLCACAVFGCDDPGTRLQAVQAPSDPQRIVCANTAAAEFVCRLVAPERIVGLPEQVDDYSGLDLKSGGFEQVPRFARYAAESVLVLKPDLVVTHEWQSADTTNVLRSQGIEVLVMKSATSFEDIRATLTSLGARVGATPKATAITHDLDLRVARLRAGAAARASLTAMVYANSGSGGTTAGMHTTPDTMIVLAGLTNAAARAGLDGHVSLDFERLLAIDPDFLIVAAPARGEAGSPTEAIVESTRALAGLKARKHGRIVVLPAALMSADSPPIVDAAELLARAVDGAIAGGK